MNWNGWIVPIVLNGWAGFVRVYHLVEVHPWEDAL